MKLVDIYCVCFCFSMKCWFRLGIVMLMMVVEMMEDIVFIISVKRMSYLKCLL